MNSIDQAEHDQNDQIKITNEITNEIRKKRTRIIRKEIGYIYADIVIKFDQSKDVEMDIRGLKLMILTMLNNLFGDSGASIPCDILKFNQQLLRAYIRFPAKYLVQVRNSLTLQSSYGGQMCSVIILKICHSLSYLPLELTNQVHNIEV